MLGADTFADTLSIEIHSRDLSRIKRRPNWRSIRSGFSFSMLRIRFPKTNGLSMRPATADQPIHLPLFQRSKQVETHRRARVLPFSSPKRTR
jgi:hypothetical protein